MNTHAKLILLIAKVHAAWLDVDNLAKKLNDDNLNEAVSLTRLMLEDTAQAVVDSKHGKPRLRAVE